ncbi:MAG: general stress protein [Canibacter sp.]
MSFFAPRQSNRRVPALTQMPEGEIVSTYDRYEDVQQAVDVLARADFPVRQLSIVGNGLRSVERITAKLSYGRIAMMGAGSGAYLGIFFGIILFIFQPGASGILGVFFAALVIGAGFGMLFAVVTFSLNRNRREYASITQVIGTRYDLITEHELVMTARDVLVKSVQDSQD